MPDHEDHTTAESVKAFNTKVVDILKDSNSEDFVELLRGESSLLKADSNHNHNNNKK